MGVLFVMEDHFWDCVVFTTVYGYAEKRALLFLRTNYVITQMYLGYNTPAFVLKHMPAGSCLTS